MIIKKTNTENRFLSSGSYGCVYYPSYNCKGQKIMDKEYVTKLVKRCIYRCIINKSELFNYAYDCCTCSTRNPTVSIFGSIIG